MAPEFAKTTLIVGVAGGALCALWGVLDLFGSRRRAWAILMLIPACFVLLSQAVMGWMAQAAGESGTRLATVLVTVMLLTSVIMVAFIAHADSGEASSADRPGRSSPPQKAS